MFETKARIFATQAHASQYRKDGITPYITHPAGVVKILRDIREHDDNILAAGWLHDVVEDCGVTEGDLRREFNRNITRIVLTLTRNVDRKTYNERIAAADYPVQIVKLADVVHNCSTLTSDLPADMIEKKIHDCDKIYLRIARSINTELYFKLQRLVNHLREIK